MVAGFEMAPERFARERLMTEALTWVVRAGHPLCAAPATLEGLVSVPHVVVAGRREAMGRPAAISLRSSWEDLGAFESELAKRNLGRRVGVVAPDTFSAMTIVARSEMAALIPRRLALLSAESGRLALIDPPYETPPVDVTLLYRKDRLAEPPIAWMRAPDQRRGGGRLTPAAVSLPCGVIARRRRRRRGSARLEAPGDPRSKGDLP